VVTYPNPMGNIFTRDSGLSDTFITSIFIEA